MRGNKSHIFKIVCNNEEKTENGTLGTKGKKTEEMFRGLERES